MPAPVHSDESASRTAVERALALYEAGPWRRLRALFALAGLWRRRMRERRALAQLDQRTLQDIGLSSDDAQWEARKPFWRK